ncbi:hypothetical protein GS597_01490 [Synechococcales cyanobacterium C]|uniref:Uncharacterized protein n=1 Tax=Petrachloros mirabilis ULC683 TaxID=2781853 RepID=A0A8K1ZWL9_9CYAN|nr:hypothetical protein [Petrachloros mirabilis]NCJ05213.1 hypothetical protein [Petrachloros mirabilis ULC683]
MIDLAARRVSLSVGGLDFTGQWVGNFIPTAQLERLDGLILTQGTFTLQSTGTEPSSLDPETSLAQWAIGTKVEIEVEDESGDLQPHPVAGTLRILEIPKYDDLSATLEVFCGCNLTFFDTRRPEGDETGIEPTESTAIATVIDRLLKAQGLASGLAGGGPTTPINYPVQKFDSESWIRQAGKLAYRAPGGPWFLYADGVGAVRALNYSSAIDLPKFTVRWDELIDIKRSNPAEFTQPYEKLTGTGTTWTLCAVDFSLISSVTYTTKGQIGQSQGVLATIAPWRDDQVIDSKTTLERVFVTPNLYRETTRTFGTSVRDIGTVDLVGNARIDRVFYEQETQRTIVETEFIGAGELEGFASRRTTEILQPGIYPPETPATAPGALPPLAQPLPSLTGQPRVQPEIPRPVSKETIEYRYNDDQYLVERTTYFERLIIKLAFNYTFYNPETDRLAGNALQGGRLQGSFPFLARVAGIRERWVRDGCGRWVRTVERLEVPPPRLDLPFIGTFTPDTKPGTFDDEPPGEPLLKPLDYSLEEESIESEAKISATVTPFFEREKRVDFGYVVGRESLEQLTEFENNWHWQRSLSRQFQMPHYDRVLDDYSPIRRFDVRFRDNSIRSFLWITPAFGLNREQAAIEIEAPLLGIAAEPNPDPIFDPLDPPSPPEPPEDPPPVNPPPPPAPPPPPKPTAELRTPTIATNRKRGGMWQGGTRGYPDDVTVLRYAGGIWVGGRSFDPEAIPTEAKCGGIWVGGVRTADVRDRKRGGVWVGGFGRIQAELPEQGGFGGVWVGGSRRLASSPAPQLTAIAPLWGRPGDAVILTGRFPALTSVQFEGQEAEFEVEALPPTGTHRIFAKVPLAGTGILTVQADGGRVRSTQLFTVFDPIATLRRGTVVIDTPVLDSLALWQGTCPLGASYSVLQLSTSEPAWVRIYNSVAAQAADVGRVFGDPPPTPRGLIVDETTTVGNLSIVLQGLEIGGVVGSNLDPPFSADIPVTIQNRSGSENIITISVLRLILENQPPPPPTVELDAALIIATPQLELDGDPGFNFEEI